MTAPILVTGKLPVPTSGGRRHPPVVAPIAAAPLGRVPRVARLLALAIKLDAEVRAGIVPDYAALARLGHVSRARITQIVNLIYLAPDIQEEILFLAPVRRGRDPIRMRQLQRVALIPEWSQQRSLWRQLKATALDMST